MYILHYLILVSESYRKLLYYNKGVLIAFKVNQGHRIWCQMKAYIKKLVINRNVSIISNSFIRMHAARVIKTGRRQREDI